MFTYLFIAVAKLLVTRIITDKLLHLLPSASQSDLESTHTHRSLMKLRGRKNVLAPTAKTHPRRLVEHAAEMLHLLPCQRIDMVVKQLLLVIVIEYICRLPTVIFLQQSTCRQPVNVRYFNLQRKETHPTSNTGKSEGSMAWLLYSWGRNNQRKKEDPSKWAKYHMHNTTYTLTRSTRRAVKHWTASSR